MASIAADSGITISEKRDPLHIYTKQDPLDWEGSGTCKTSMLATQMFILARADENVAIEQV